MLLIFWCNFEAPLSTQNVEPRDRWAGALLLGTPPRTIDAPQHAKVVPKWKPHWPKWGQVSPRLENVSPDSKNERADRLIWASESCFFGDGLGQPLQKRHRTTKTNDYIILPLKDLDYSRIADACTCKHAVRHATQISQAAALRANFSKWEGPSSKFYTYIYIYIYTERERERGTQVYTHAACVHMKMPVFPCVVSPAMQT